MSITAQLSEKLQTKIDNINSKWNKTKKEYINDLLDIYDTAILEGFSPVQAGSICREKVDIFSDRTIMRALPSAATRSYSKPNVTNVKSYTSDIQIQNKSLPPRPEVVREAEIVREPPKPIDRPIAIPSGDRKIKLDTGKFRSDLRIALINGAKVWLSYNNNNEVISIIEM